MSQGRGTGGSTKVSTELAKHRDEFTNRLKQRKLSESSYDVASETMKYLRRLVGQGRYGNFKELLALVKSEGEILVKADPTEFVVGNMVLRVLKLIREEHARLMSGKDDMNLEDPHDSLHKLWEREDAGVAQIRAKELKAAVIETLSEFMSMELSHCREAISTQSTDHIQDGDLVLTLGHSHTVEAFLKVVLGAHAILADGGFIGASGTKGLTLAAKRYSVPVIVLGSFYKLTPKFLSSVNQESFNRLESPRNVIPFSQGDLVSGAEVMNVAFDFIPPQLLTLFITQTGGNSPSYVYRLLTENYHPEDVTLMSSQKS